MALPEEQKRWSLGVRKPEVASSELHGFRKTEWPPASETGKVVPYLWPTCPSKSTGHTDFNTFAE